MRWIVALIFLLAPIQAWATVHVATTCSRSDVNEKVVLAVDADTVQIPAGNCSWSSGITISGKGIKIEGAGAGSFQGDSTTSLTIGTGTKVFTTQSGLTFVGGQTVRAIVKHNPALFVEGTVTTYTGTTLTLDITSIGGSGTVAFWTLAIIAVNGTTITHTAGGANLFTITEDTTHSVEISGIKFLEGAGSVNGTHIAVFYASGGKPVLLYDCWLSTSGAMLRGLQWSTNGGVIYRCSFDEDFAENIDEAIVFNPSVLTSSWTTISTMGMSDTTGLSNTYVEGCYFAAISLSALDFDNNARVVVRYNTFDNTGFGSHGQDSSIYGVRQFEVYNNRMVFNNMGTDTYNLNWYFQIRGGTGVITDNVMPNITSQAWGDKGEVLLSLFNIRRVTSIPCQTVYPATRQPGRGYTNGLGGTTESYGYTGDLEPIYIWNNSGSPVVVNNEYQPDECGNGQLISNYVQLNRDWYASAKPSYMKFTYPHPLTVGAVLDPPTGLSIGGGRSRFRRR